MSNQAVYDAVRSRISSCDTTEVLRDVAMSALDFSMPRIIAQQEIAAVGMEMTRPSVLFRPRVYRDGGAWCALYGENLQEGVAGFGESPDAAVRDFDKEWTRK